MAGLEFLYLSRGDIEALDLDIREVISAVEEGFREKAEGRVEVPPKPGIHPVEDAFIHAMPAYIPRMGSAGIKWVSGYPENYKHGLPYIMGILILNDPSTGAVISIMDATWITAKRTGAATAIAAKYLAREDSRVFTILGCGVQGRSNLEAVLALFPGLEEVAAYDPNEKALKRYKEEVEEKYGLTVTPAPTPKAAVEVGDIIVTAGPILKDSRPVIGASWLKEGCFGCALDFSSYWRFEAMAAMDKFCTDDTPQLEYYRSLGYFPEGVPAIYADLGELVSGRKKGREGREERNMSMNLGLAIEDMTTALKIYEEARRKGIGQWLPL